MRSCCSWRRSSVTRAVSEASVAIGARRSGAAMSGSVTPLPEVSGERCSDETLGGEPAFALPLLVRASVLGSNSGSGSRSG